MISTLAALISALGVGMAGVALLATRSVPTALGVLLDMLVAAGLLGLVGEQSWSSLAAVAAILVVRTMLRSGLLAADRQRSAAKRPPAGRPSGRRMADRQSRGRW